MLIAHAPTGAAGVGWRRRRRRHGDPSSPPSSRSAADDWIGHHRPGGTSPPWAPGSMQWRRSSRSWPDNAFDAAASTPASRHQPIPRQAERRAATVRLDRFGRFHPRQAGQVTCSIRMSQSTRSQTRTTKPINRPGATVFSNNRRSLEGSGSVCRSRPPSLLCRCQRTGPELISIDFCSSLKAVRSFTRVQIGVPSGATNGVSKNRCGDPVQFLMALHATSQAQRYSLGKYAIC
jgi:hypothetical protein